MSTSRSGRCARSTRLPQFVAFAAGAAMGLASIGSQAQAQVWQGPIGGSWATAAAWVGGVAPVSGSSTTLSFTNQYTPAGWTAANNITTNPFVLNSITVENQASGTNALLISSSNPLQFDGAGAQIVFNGGGVSNISPTINLATDLLLTGTGRGTLGLTGNIASVPAATPRNVTIALDSRAIFDNFLGGTNFTGNWNLNSGILSLRFASGLGNTNGTLIANGGSLRAAQGSAVSTNVTLNSNLNVGFAAGTTASIWNGVFSGNGGLVLQSILPATNLGAASTTSLGATNTYSGATVIGGGYNSTINVSLATATGALSNTSGITVNASSTLTLDNATASTVSSGRVGDSVGITLNRGNLIVSANSSAATSETIGTLSFNGAGAVAINPASSAINAATTLTVASLNRQDRGTLNVSGAAIGTQPAATGVANLIVSSAPTLTGGGGAAGTTNVSILPYATVRNTVTAGTTFSGTTTSSYDGLATIGANGVRALSDNEYNTNLYLLRGTTTDQNVRVDSGASNLNGAFIDRPTGINALVLNSPTGASTKGSSVFGPTTLTVNSGAIVLSTQAGTTDTTFAQTIGVSTLAFGSAEGIVHANRSGIIASTITGSNGFTKSGFGTLALTGNNTFSGPVTIAHGVLAISSDSALGAAGNSITNSGGVAGGLSFTPNPYYTAGNASSITVNRAMNLAGSGGALQASQGPTTLNYDGVISGSGNLLIAGAGLTRLNSSSNSYTGNTIVIGNLGVASDGALGNGGDLVLQGGVLRTLGSFSTSRNVQVPLSTVPSGLATAANIYTDAGHTLTLNGVLGTSGYGSSGTALVKFGSGNLVLTAQNTLSSALQVGSTGLVNSAGSVVSGGALTLSGSEGSLRSIPQSLVLSGSQLVLDNAASNNNNRLPTALLTLGAGELKLVGNAAGTTEVIGGVAYVSNSGAGTAIGGQSVITVQADAAGGAALVATSLGRSGATPGTILIRGSNLGSTPGAGNANVFVGNIPGTATSIGTSPTVTNGAIPGVIVDKSATGTGSDFATYSTTTGITPLASYSVNTFGATNNVDVTSAQTLAAVTSANLLRISTGGSIATGGNNLNVGGSTLGGMVLVPAGVSTSIVGGGTLTFGTSTTGGIIHAAGDLDMRGTGLGTSIGGLNSLIKTGQGLLTLNTTNTALTGTVTVGGGTVRYTGAASIPAGATVIVQPSSLGGATLDLNGNAATLSALVGLGTLNLGTGGSLSVGTLTLQGNITGSGPAVGPAITITSGATLSGISTFTGSTLVRSGVLALNANQTATSGPLGSSSDALLLGDTAGVSSASLVFGNNVSTFAKDINVQAGNTGTTAINQGSSNTGAQVAVTGNIALGKRLRLTGSNSNGTLGSSLISLDGTISGAGDLEIFGGQYNITGNNTFTGGVILDAGNTVALGIGSDTALGTGAVSVTSFAGSLKAIGGARSIANAFTFSSVPSTALQITGTNDFTSTGNWTLANGNTNLLVTNLGRTTLSGIISGGSTTGNTLTKTGGGVLAITGANTFTGTTILADGLTLANNLTGSAFSTGGVTVQGGALLGGNGFVTGTVTLAAGAIIAPGADAGVSIGTLTLGGITSVASSIFTFDLDTQGVVGGTTNDLIALTSGLTSIVGTVDICPKPGFSMGVYTLFTFTGGGNVPLAGQNLTLTSAFQSQYPGMFLDYSEPGTVRLIPTPGAAGMLGLGALFAARRRRSK